MNFNGIDTTGGGGGGGGGEGEFTTLCAETATFEELRVGACLSPEYTFPTANKAFDYPGVRVEDGGGTITLDVINRLVTIYYDVSDAFSLPGNPAESVTYTLRELVRDIQDGVNTYYGGQGITNVFSMWIAANGKVQCSHTPGNKPTIRIPITFVCGAGFLNNTVAADVPPNTIYEFTGLPVTTGTLLQPTWKGYNFDDTGNVFEGDLVVRGSLTTNTIVSELQVEDAIINCNLNAAGDGNTSGLVLHSFSNTRYSGLLKANNSSDFYLFANSATVPTPVGWFPEFSGNLVAARGNFGTNIGVGAASQVEVFSPGGAVVGLQINAGPTMTERLQVWRNNGAEVGSFSKDGVLTCSQISTNILSATAPVTFGNPVGAGAYTMPLSRGTDRQIMRIDGAGALSFATNDQLDSPDGLSSLTTANNNLTATVSNGVNTIECIDCTSTITNIRGGSSELRMTDGPAGIRLTRASIIRMAMTTDDTSLFNGADNTRFQLFEKTIRMSTQDAGGAEQERLLIDTAQSLINSPDGSQSLLLTDSTFQLNSAATTYFTGTATSLLGVLSSTPRLSIAPTVSDLISPGGVSKIRVFDDRVETNVRIKCLANAEVSGQLFVGQLIGAAQANVYSTLNNRVGLCIDAPPTTTAELQLWAVNNTPVASVENTGKGVFPALSTDSLDARAANPLAIGSVTANAVDISKAGTLTTIKGQLEVDEATRLEGGASVGTVAAGYTLPSVRATSQGQVITTDGAGNAFWLGSILYTADINCETQTTTPIAATGAYVTVQGVANTSTVGFTPAIGSAQVTYTGAETITVALFGGLSAESEDLAGMDNAIFRMALHKNGAKLPGFSTAQFDSTSNYPQEFCLMRTITLSTGDTLSIRVANQTDTRNLIVYNYTLTAHKIGI